MIVCSCNQLTDSQVRDALTGDSGTRPRSPGQVYLCLGCKPNCGRCVSQIRQMFSDITAGKACQIGCASCPGETAAQAIAAQITAPPRAPAGGAPRRRFVVPEAQRYRPAPRPAARAPGAHAQTSQAQAALALPASPARPASGNAPLPARIAAE
ncbi:bacterioferritin-associated ferredoxin [Camelimonas abortus]|uniref:Bacterioferritin-associated ferredoxin n=2 Tax=Camelimonas abortus TaxID=1017184 RepID=A0ABV7LFN1_9HYPH